MYTTPVRGGFFINPIPTYFSSSRLKVVDFSSNKIQSIPHELASIGSLTTLNLSLNQLEDLPSFEKAVNLSHLDVSSNQCNCFDIGFRERACNIS